MIFLYKCIGIKVTEQIVNPIIVSQLILMFRKMKINKIKITKWQVF